MRESEENLSSPFANRIWPVEPQNGSIGFRDATMIEKHGVRLLATFNP
jgi:hypothetical protein